MKPFYLPSVCITLYQLFYFFFALYRYRCQQKPFCPLFPGFMHIDRCQLQLFP